MDDYLYLLVVKQRILCHRPDYAYYGLVSYPQYKKIAALVSLSPPNLKDCSEEQSFSTATLIAGLSGRPLRLLTTATSIAGLSGRPLRLLQLPL